SFELAHLADHRRPTRGDIVADGRAGLAVSKAESLGLRDVEAAGGWKALYDQNGLVGYDAVVVGLPPLESGPELRMAAQNLDGILLVLKWGATDVDKVERAIAVSGVGASEFIGAVLNMMDERMVGKFGDKLWAAEAKLVARRRAPKFR